MGYNRQTVVIIASVSPVANTAAALTSAFEKTPTRLTRCAHSSYADLIKLIPTGYTNIVTFVHAKY